MKVQVILTVDLDPKVWAAEYGLAESEVRGDVKTMVHNAVYEHLVNNLRIARDVTVKS